MLPGFRQLLLAFTATVALVVLGLAQLAKYEVAQTHSATPPAAEIRFAGLAFAARADWTPETRPHPGSLESLPPFARTSPAVPWLRHEATPAPARVEAVVTMLATAPMADFAEPVHARLTDVAALPPALAVPALLPESPVVESEIAAATQPAGRIVFAALPLPISDAVALPPLRAAATSTVDVAESVPPGLAPVVTAAGAEAHKASRPEAAVMAALETIPLSQVKLPPPRPRIAARPVPAKPASTPLARPKPAVAGRPAARANATRARRPQRPAAPAPQPDDPFAFLFGQPHPATTPAPRN